jgi:error-prone DNA polymerase
MYPKRLILDDARSLGIAVLGLDVNASTGAYRIERIERWAEPPPRILDQTESRSAPAHPDLPDARAYGIRLSLADVKGISEAEVARIVAGQPYFSLADFWNRARVSRPVAERLVLAGGFDSLYGMGGSLSGLGRRGRVTRRDLLLHVAELDRWSRSVASSRRRVSPRRDRAGRADGGLGAGGLGPDGLGADGLGADGLGADGPGMGAPARSGTDAGGIPGPDVRGRAAAQSQAARPVAPPAAQPTQLALDLGDSPELTAGTGLPEMTGPERVRAELDILGLDASAHVMEFYAPLLRALGVTRSADLLTARSRSTVWAGGVKVATQTPPVRSGRRVVFLTLDDSTGPVDVTFFEDVQSPYAEVVFHSWMLLVRGVVRRTGPRGISLRATGAWELSRLWDAWTAGGLEAVLAAIDRDEEAALAQARAAEEAAAAELDTPGQPQGRRVLVHASGFRQSPYADIRPAGGDVRDAHRLAQGETVPDGRTPPRKLWHSSPGSSGH